MKRAAATPCEPFCINSMNSLNNALRTKARALFARASAFNSRKPPEGSLMLAVETDAGDRRHIGLLVPAVQDLIQGSALAGLFHFGKEQAALHLAPGKNLEETLALAARTFHDEGLFFQWRNELLDVVDVQSSTVISCAERGLFRFLGMATRCVYAVGTLEDGRIFMSRRSLTKQVDPGLWDCLAAGLVAADEAPEVSLAREISEEAGLACGQWRTAGSWSCFPVRRPVEEGWMHEDALIMPVTVTDPARVHNNDGEVMAIELKSPDEVLERIAADLVPSDTAIAFLYATAAVQE